MTADLFELELLHVTGTPTEMGRAHGEQLRDRIRAFVTMRLETAADYVRDRGRASTEGILELGRQSMAIAADWDPVGHAEHLGLAEGAGVDPATLYAAANLTDMRDALVLSGPPGSAVDPFASAEGEGCTSLLVPPAATPGDQGLVGQTWDLQQRNLDFVVAVHRRPSEGPETWCITCAGCLSLIGMNAHGLTVGTTNIKTYGARAGVGYLSLIHRALAARDVAEASALVRDAPVAGAHTYWLADGREQVEWEVSPLGGVVRTTDEGPIWRANHCLWDTHRAAQGESPSPSSLARYRRMGELVRDRPIDLAGLRAIFTDRRDGPRSINRHAGPETDITTNSVFLARPATRELWACRGPADRGRWISFAFADPGGHVGGPGDAAGGR